MNRNIEPCWLLNISWWCIIIYNLVAGNYSKSMWWFRDSKPKELCFLRPSAFNTHPETVLTRGTHVCQCIKNQIIMQQSQHELGSSFQFVQVTPRRPWPCKMCIGWVFVLQPAGKLTLQAHMFTVAAIQTISNDDPCLGLLVDFVMHSLMKPPRGLYKVGMQKWSKMDLFVRLVQVIPWNPGTTGRRIIGVN